MLPRLRQMSWDERKALQTQINEPTGEIPLHLYGELGEAEKKRLVFPLWSDKPLTGCQTVALMVFSLWCQLGEDARYCGSLWESWPIYEALILCDGPDKARAVKDLYEKPDCPDLKAKSDVNSHPTHDNGRAQTEAQGPAQTDRPQEAGPQNRLQALDDSQGVLYRSGIPIGPAAGLGVGV